VTASFAKYVSAIANSIADSSSPAGNPQTFPTNRFPDYPIIQSGYLAGSTGASTPRRMTHQITPVNAAATIRNVTPNSQSVV